MLDLIMAMTIIILILGMLLMEVEAELTAVFLEEEKAKNLGEPKVQ